MKRKISVCEGEGKQYKLEKWNIQCSMNRTPSNCFHWHYKKAESVATC